MASAGATERTTLGASTLTVSRLGFGCWALGGHGWGAVDEQEIMRAIHDAIDMGINFFDTADVYGFGRSEELLGRAITGRAEEVIVATKFGVTWDDSGAIGRNASPEYVRFALDASLRRLRLERIPLYQLHWPDPETPIADTIETLIDCRKEGKIGYIGCSNLSSTQLREALSVTDITSLQSPYSLIDREVEETLLPLCESSNTGFLAYGPLAMGLLTGKYDREARFGDDDVRSRSDNFRGERFEANLATADAVREVAARTGRSAAQVATRWVLDHHAVSSAITGIKDRRQLADNAGALGWHLTAADRDHLGSFSPTAGVGTDG